MSIVALNFEDGYPGATVLAGSISGLSGTGGVTGTTITYDTSMAQYGSKSVKLGAVAGGVVYLEVSGFSVPQLALDFAFRTQEVFTQETTLVTVLDSSYGIAFRLYANATNNLVLQNGAGQAVYTSTQTIPTNQWLRFSLFGKTGATTGSLKFNYYLGTSKTPVETGYSKMGTEAMRTQPIIIARLGKTLSTSTHVGTLWVDALQYDTAATDALPAWPTSSAMVWTGSQWERYKPFVWDGTVWNDEGNLF